MLKSIGSAVLDLIFPPRCPCCGELNIYAQPCADCAVQLLQWEHPLQGFGDCDAVAVAFTYEGVARSMLLRYKRMRLSGIVDTLAPYVAVAVRRQLSAYDFSCCSCVPGGAESTRVRGFSSSQLLAERVAALLELPFVPLLQHTGLRPQKELDRAARFRNAAASFCLAPAAAGQAPQGDILLVDDIMTTGASLQACAALLARAGAPAVAAAVAAYDPPQ